jgi:alpha-L-rhamnosidase
MWEKDLPGHSLLHSSYLYPGAWYVEGVAGIRCDVKTPGYRKFIVRMPKLTESQISSAKATFDSPAGRIKTDWKRQDGHLMLSLTVPPNCGATVYVPSENNQEIIESSGYAKKIGTKDGYVLFEVPAGKYEFKN